MDETGFISQLLFPFFKSKPADVAWFNPVVVYETTVLSTKLREEAPSLSREKRGEKLTSSSAWRNFYFPDFSTEKKKRQTVVDPHTEKMNGRRDIVHVVSSCGKTQTSKWRRTPGMVTAIWPMSSWPTRLRSVGGVRENNIVGTGNPFNRWVPSGFTGLLLVFNSTDFSSLPV